MSAHSMSAVSLWCFPRWFFGFFGFICLCAHSHPTAPSAQAAFEASTTEDGGQHTYVASAKEGSSHVVYDTLVSDDIETLPPILFDERPLAPMKFVILQTSEETVI